MATLKINGDTSGYVELVSPAVAGSTSIELDKILVSDSSGNVGIGTTSPNTTLDIVSPSNAEAIHIRGRSADDTGQLKFYENDGTTSLARLDSRTTHFEVGSYNELRFSAGGVGNSHVVIDTSGNLLLGKSANGTGTVGVELNPDGTLVGTRSGGNPLFLNRTTSDGKIITLRRDGNEIGYIGSNTTAGQTLLDISSEDDSSSNIRFLTYGSGSQNEVMRLASNKMVGIGITAPTASWGNGTGVQFNPAGEVLASKVNGTSLYLNRTSSSGSNRAVISINENSSNIGTIGMGSGSELAISTNAGTQYISQKLNGDTDGVQYSNVGTYHFGPWISKNATIDLGRSSSGWRDLYLTGGIQFDARSNKLDDYEEGEWTYSLPCVGGGSFTPRANYLKGFYTKIGRLVTIHLRYETQGSSSPSGDIQLAGLPFNVDTTAPTGGSASYTYPILLRGASNSSYEWDYSFHIGLTPGTTTGKFYGQGDGSSHSYRALQATDISSNFEGSICLTYKTNQ